MKRFIQLFVGASFLILYFLLSLVPTYQDLGPIFAILTQVPMGWWHFLKRNLPQITINWNSVATGVVFSVLILLAAHWLFGALFKRVKNGPIVETPPRRWRWRWTFSVYAGFWLLFAIACGAVGVFREASWLADYHRPWYQEQPGLSYEFALGIHAIEDVVAERDGDPVAIRKSFISETNWTTPLRTLCIENYDVPLFMDKSNLVTAYVIVPRTLPPGGKAQFFVMRGSAGKWLPMSELSKTMAELNASHSRSE